MCFLLKTVTHQDLRDSDGRLLPTVICESLGEQAREDIRAAGRKDEDDILALIAANPKISLAEMARAMDWKLHGGDPNKMRAKRCVAPRSRGPSFLRRPGTVPCGPLTRAERR